MGRRDMPAWFVGKSWGGVSKTISLWDSFSLSLTVTRREVRPTCARTRARWRSCAPQLLQSAPRARGRGVGGEFSVDYLLRGFGIVTFQAGKDAVGLPALIPTAVGATVGILIDPSPIRCRNFIPPRTLNSRSNIRILLTQDEGPADSSRGTKAKSTPELVSAVAASITATADHLVNGTPDRMNRLRE